MVVAVVQMISHYVRFLGSFIHHDMHVSIVVRCAHGHGPPVTLPLFSLSLSFTRNLRAIHLPTSVTF